MINVIYYSNIFDYYREIGQVTSEKNFFDISTTNLVKNSNEYIEIEDILNYYMQTEYIKQIEFVISYCRDDKHMKFKQSDM